MEQRHIAQIFPNDKNPGIYNNPDPDGLHELAEGIKKHGIKEPLVITESGKLISGHRRYYAAIKAGLHAVPVRYERDILDDDHELELLVEYNRQRRKTATEIYNEAQVIRGILDKRQITGRTSDHIAKQIGLGSGRNLEKLEYVQEHAPQAIKEQLDRGDVSIHHAYTETKKINQAPEAARPAIVEAVESGKSAGQAKAQVKAAANATLAQSLTPIAASQVDALVVLPNWDYSELGMPNYGPARWYAASQPVVSSEQIAAMELQQHLKDNGYLFLFASQHFVSQAYDVMVAMGLMPVGMLSWVDANYQTTQPSLIKDDVLYCVIGYNGDEMPALNLSGWFNSAADAGALPPAFYSLVSKIKPRGAFAQVFVSSNQEGWTSL